VHLVGPYYANTMMHCPQNITEALVVASKVNGLEENSAKTKYMVMYRDQIEGQNYCINFYIKPFEVLEQLKHLGTTVTNKNSIQEQIKRKLKPRNICYLSVQKFLSSSLLYKTCYTIQLMHYSHFTTQSLQHLKPIKRLKTCLKV
jgi:hypothetical protein